jgi:hypothetical protein
MTKFTKQDERRILAQARKNLAGHRPQALRKQNVPPQGTRMTERQREREPQQSSRTSGVPEFDRDILIDLVAAILGVVLRRQS